METDQFLFMDSVTTNLERPNHTTQRMRASRLAQFQPDGHWRLVPTADGDR